MTAANQSWRERVRRAFAVDPPGPAEPTPQQQIAVDWVCRQVAKRQLTTPGLLAMEMSRPLNFIGAQLMHFMQPAMWALASQKGYDGYVHFSEFLERRGSLDYMMRRIEHFEDEYQTEEKHRRERSTPKSSAASRDESSHG